MDYYKGTFQETWINDGNSKESKVICSFGIMLTEMVSNKPDRKEPKVEQKWKRAEESGRFLAPRSRERNMGWWMKVILLVFWDGLLLYMIVGTLIVPVYGAAFIAVVSIYLGYNL